MFTCIHTRTSHAHSYITRTSHTHSYITRTLVHHTHTRTSHAHHMHITCTYITRTLVHHTHTHTSHAHACTHSLRGIPLPRNVFINTAVLLVTVAYRSEREKQYNNITKELVLSNTQTLCIITLT